MSPKPLLLALSLLLPGCIFAINVGDSNPSPRAVDYPGNAIPSTVTTAEITAAASLSMDDNRTPALNAIAARPALTPPEQVFLVYTATRRLSFSSNRVIVLSTLIHNPSFSPDAKQAILHEFPKLSFDSEKSEILKELNALPQQPAASAN